MRAGRVQSVALRLVCERESQIEAFSHQEYWSVLAQLQPDQADPFHPFVDPFEARLVKASYPSHKFFVAVPCGSLSLALSKQRHEFSCNLDGRGSFCLAKVLW
jgi:hypothetical protein